MTRTKIGYVVTADGNFAHALRLGILCPVALDFGSVERDEQYNKPIPPLRDKHGGLIYAYPGGRFVVNNRIVG